MLKVWDLTDRETRGGLQRLDVLTEAAEAARLACDAPAAMELLQEALAGIDEDEYPTPTASLLERLGRCLWEDGHTDEAAGVYEHGNRLLQSVPDSELRARLLAAEGRMLMVLGRFDKSLEISNAAVKMARYADARAVELDATITLGVDLVMTGETTAGLTMLRDSCRIAAQDGGVEDLVRAYGNLAAALGRLTELERSVQIADEGMEELAKRDLPKSVGGALLTNSCDSLVALGRWDEAKERIVSSMQTRLPAIHSSFLYRILGEIETARGEFELAAPALDRAREFAVDLREPQYIAPLHVARRGARHRTR